MVTTPRHTPLYLVMVSPSEIRLIRGPTSRRRHRVRPALRRRRRSGMPRPPRHQHSGGRVRNVLTPGAVDPGMGLHSSTSQVDLSRFCHCFHPTVPQKLLTSSTSRRTGRVCTRPRRCGPRQAGWVGQVLILVVCLFGQVTIFVASLSGQLTISIVIMFVKLPY
jgi:hypothetical protein